MADPHAPAHYEGGTSEHQVALLIAERDALAARVESLTQQLAEAEGRFAMAADTSERLAADFAALVQERDTLRTIAHAASVYRAHMEGEPSLANPRHIEWESVSYQLEADLDDLLRDMPLAAAGSPPETR